MRIRLNRTSVFSLLAVFISAPTFALTMEEAFRAALEKNELVKQSAEQVVQADERIAQVRGGLFPEISLNALHLIQPLVNEQFREFSPPNQTTANLSVKQPIFRGLREFAGLRQQGDLLVAQEAIRRVTIQRLYQDVAANYMNVLTLEADSINLKEQLDISEKRVGELRTRARRGESSQTELLSTLSSHAATQAEIRLLKGQLQVARDILQSLTGLPRDSKLVDPKLIPDGKKVVVDSLSEYLAQIEQRPDVQAAVAQREATGEGRAIARGVHFPVIDAVGNYYLRRPGFLKDLKWDISLQFSLPLFAGGATLAEVREAASRDKEAELELARIRRVAGDEIRTLHETVQARIEHLSILREAAEIEQKNVTVSQNDFRRGLIRNIDVQLALGAYRATRRSLDQAHFAAQMDLLKLEVAAGLKPQGLNSGNTQ
jgi:outer membrane protein